MPTIPPERADHSDLQPHHARSIAESFGSDVERYDRARPSYPSAMVERIIASSPGPDLLDVGCGTGIEGRQLQAAGCRVLGVEPDARMAEFARRSGLEVEVATFENWKPAGRTFDALVAGTVWHWVDPVVGAAKAAHVLRPGGRMAAFWNGLQPPSEVTEAFVEAYRHVAPDSPFDPDAMRRPAMESYQVLLTKTADGLRQTRQFGEPEQWRYDAERSYTRSEWLDQLPTSGALTRLPQDKLSEVLEAVGAAIDAMGGSISTQQITVVLTATRTGSMADSHR